MTTKIANKIRELRKNKKISQEVLAQALGVSFQTVSKWENDLAMPDITLLPALASFFDVSIDELFDYNRLETERKVEEICDRAYEYRASDPARSEAILREGLKQFPGNDIILNNLLYTIRTPERSGEVVTICKSLIESTHDDEVKYDALRILAETYHSTSQQALVAPTLEQIPEIYFTKLELMAELLEGEASFNAAKSQMGIGSESTVEMLLIMRKRLLESGQVEEAAKVGRIAKGIVDVFRREEGESFVSGNFYRWMLEELEKLP